MTGIQPKVSNINFSPIAKPKDGHIGFVSVLYDGRIRLSDIAVHVLRSPKAGRHYRLVYPQNNKTKKNSFHPIDPETSKLIEKKVNVYLLDTQKEWTDGKQED